MKKHLLVYYTIVTIAPLVISLMLSAQNTSPYWSLTGNSNAAPSSKLGTTNDVSLRFYTNNVQRMIINSVAAEGYVGIGTLTPTERLHINSASGKNVLRAQINGSTKFLVHSLGGVAIGGGTTPPSNGLYVAGRTGIGTASPENILHVFKGSAGSVTADANSTVVVENSTSNYISLLAPGINESGILFGKPESNVSGGIIYNSGYTPNGLQFRTDVNTTRMVLDNNGNLGVGTYFPSPYIAKVSHGAYGFNIENATTKDNWEFFIFGTSLRLFCNSALRGAFDGNTGAYTMASDERLKTAIKPMTSMLKNINKLKPSTFQFKANPTEYTGFIAQDVMKVFPSLVSHNVDKDRGLDVYTVDYSGFGVIAIKGIQELQPTIEEQKKINEEQRIKITAMEERIMKLETALAAITASGNVYNLINNGSLEQNKPNPFTQKTTIRYSVPQSSKGQINIYEQTGKLVKTFRTNESGRTELNGYDLATGTYTYTLMVDGKVVLSKQMLIIK